MAMEEQGQPQPEPAQPAASRQPQVVVQVGQQGPGCLVRALWFVFVGWWLGQLAVLSAWFLNLLILTLPLGMYILNRLPQIFTLRPSSVQWQVQQVNPDVAVVSAVEVPQRDFWVRTVYFVLVGWWFSLIWLEVAWLAGLTLILLPLSFWMFSMSAAVTTLRRT
jgi:uncharacterized membrane protein YccF (DUF307 family)